MIFGSVMEHFANLRDVKDAKFVFRAKMHYFEVSKLRSIQSTLLDPKWWLGVFGTILLTFRCKKMKNLCFRPECTISAHQSCEASILLHRSQNNVWECFRALCFRHVKWWKLVSRAWMHYFTVPKLWNIHSIPLDTKWYLGVLRSTSLTFCM
jgi:hypothetical protein